MGLNRQALASVRRTETSLRPNEGARLCETDRMSSMSNATESLPGFWQVQTGSWALLYVLVLLPALPHLRESGIFAYNTWAILLLFAASLALRPLLRYASARWASSWLRLEGLAFATCFVAGTVTTFLTALLTFGLRDFRWSYWTLSGVQCAMTLFLWATLYLSIKHWRRSPDLIAPDLQTAPTLRETEELAKEQSPYPAQFAARVGPRIQIVRPDQVLWVAAARDYAELHTRTSVHLLRETLTSLEKKLDPDRFLRIHRSRIVRVDQIVELIAMDNSEYRVRLRDGSEHRSSRTYAPSLASWVRSGRLHDAAIR
jgi:hypothetical protein